MGYYSEYLSRNMPIQDVVRERRDRLACIAKLRGRDVLVIAADLTKSDAPTSLGYEDLLPINDLLSDMEGSAVDVIIETPGGSAEVAEDVVKALHKRFTEVSFIVPGWAKSAGTIMVMAGNEILMDRTSALGPIDAQLLWQGKIFSADALLEGIEKIKEETERTNNLNLAYIPILQGISPGELQSAKNALAFAEALVSEWLVRYKFTTWTSHRDGRPVTDQEKQSRAEKIAHSLCDHRRWLTHARSLQIDDLRDMKLVINDVSQTPELHEALQRYYALLQMTFATNIYKVYENPAREIVKLARQPAHEPHPSLLSPQPDVVLIEVACPKCRTQVKVQANMGKTQPLQDGAIPFPADDQLACVKCGSVIDLSGARRDMENKTGRPVVE